MNYSWIPKRYRSLLKTLRSRTKTALGIPEEQWGRFVMRRETAKLIHELEPHELNVLEISGNFYDRPDLFKSYKNISYPEYDICNGTLPERFDLIIAEEVFEHLLYPYRAGRNVYSMLNPGGYFLLTTPFLVRIHNAPIDCTRWTETGMKHFLHECGFPLAAIHTGSWGNRACVVGNFKYWANYIPLLHSLKNEPLYPFNVWALAKKEG